MPDQSPPLPAPPRRLDHRPPPERDILTAKQSLELARSRRRPLRGAARGLLIAVVVVALLAGLFAAAAALDTNHERKSAPWATPSTPVVKPPPLAAQ